MFAVRVVSAVLVCIPLTAQSRIEPEAVKFASGTLQLSGRLWKPAGRGRFPAVLFNHGSGKDPLPFAVAMAERFVSHGYVFFAPYRRGHGDSAGPYILDLINKETERAGNEAGQLLTMKLLETDHFADQMAALAWLKQRDEVIGTDISVVGHSYGGIQTMLAAEKALGIRAAVNFAGAAMSWGNTALRERLLRAAAAARVPVLFIQAQNDFSTEPSRELCAEMRRKNKACSTRIYPPHGSAAKEAHFFAYQAPAVWEEELFRFLEDARRKTGKKQPRPLLPQGVARLN
jgi:dienelactone hydrolase